MNYFDIRKKIDEILIVRDSVARLKITREVALALTKLDEAEMWLSRLADDTPADAEGEL